MSVLMYVNTFKHAVVHDSQPTLEPKGEADADADAAGRMTSSTIFCTPPTVTTAHPCGCALELS
jgi:hypothetical protein